VLLTGCSAGGLATYLHADYVASIVPASVTKYRVAPISG
jgi:O-palmitoleoyl-L-serine hydrolase